MAGSAENGFEDYVATTRDPGAWILVLTLLFGALSYVLLILFVVIGRKRQRRRKLESGTDEEESKTSSRRLRCQKDKDSHVGDDESVRSAHSVASSFISQVFDRTRVKHRAALERRAKEAVAADDDDGVGSEMGSVASKSVMGKLDPDAVSFHDAVDAQDPAYLIKRQSDGEEEIQSWTCATTFNYLLVIAEWDYETKRIWKLACPYISEAVVTGVCDTVKVAIIGNFVGTPQVTAYVTVDIFLGLTTGFLSGFMECMATLCSQASGSGNRLLVGQYVQLALGFFIIFNIPFIIMWLCVVEDLFGWLGFDDETVLAGKEFAWVFLLTGLAEGINSAVHELLDIVGYEVYSSIVVVTSEIISTLAILVAVFAGKPTLQQIGLIDFAITCLSLVFNVVYVWHMRWVRKYYDGMFRTNAFKNKAAVAMMLKTSSALSLGWLLAYGEWEILTVFASFLGPAEVAAWGLLGTVWDALELVTEAVADAAEVRCAFLIGSGKPYQAKLSAYKSILMAWVASLLMTSIVFIIGDDLPRMLTSDPTLREMLSELIPLFGIGNIALTMGTMAWTLVGSQGRYTLSTAVGFFGSWVITMPLAAALCIGFNINLEGQAFAVVVGYMLSGTMNTYFLLLSDWKKLSDGVVEYNEMHSICVSED